MTDNSVQTETCIVCAQEKTQGIHVCEQFICTDCEREMVHTDTSDANYQHYVHCLRRLWNGSNFLAK